MTLPIPAADAISAATTFDRMPPDPSGDGAWPICNSDSASGSVTSSTSSAPASARGSAV